SFTKTIIPWPTADVLSFRVLRSVLGITAQQLARSAHVSARELRRIESGAVTPKPQTVIALHAAFERIWPERLAFASEGRTKGAASPKAGPEKEERRDGDGPRNQAALGNRQAHIPLVARRTVLTR